MIKLDKPPYKSKSNGFLTAVLFLERWVMVPEVDRGYLPLFSFQGVEGYIDCRKTFVEMGDPTGYKWAMTYLGHFAHWEKLMQAPWFVTEYESWKRELQAKQKSEAFQAIKETAGEPGPQRYLAAKYIAAQEYDKPASGRGRPSKSELQGELRRAVDKLSQEDADAQRMGLEVN